jgi:hypothetical protein
MSRCDDLQELVNDLARTLQNSEYHHKLRVEVGKQFKKPVPRITYDLSDEFADRLTALRTDLAQPDLFG